MFEKKSPRGAPPTVSAPGLCGALVGGAPRGDYVQDKGREGETGNPSRSQPGLPQSGREAGLGHTGEVCGLAATGRIQTTDFMAFIFKTPSKPRNTRSCTTWSNSSTPSNKLANPPVAITFGRWPSNSSNWILCMISRKAPR